MSPTDKSAPPGRKPGVLMTASTLPRWDGDTEPRFILELAEALADDFDVTVLAPHCAGAARKEHMGRVKVVRFRYAPARWEQLAYEGGMLHKLRAQPWRWLLVPAFLLGQCLAIWRLLRRRSDAVIHAHWIVPQGMAVAPLKALRLLRNPLLLTSHGGDLFSLRGPLAGTLKSWIVRQADRVSVVSRAMVGPCRELGVAQDRICVRSMGVDLASDFVSKTPYEDRQGIIFVGRLVEKKGVATLIEAFARLLQHHPDQRLQIVGGGPLYDQLTALADRLGVSSQVRFTGPVEHSELPALFNAASIAVMPSVVATDGDQEGLGLVAVEALGCGCAVVCSDLPAMEDVITHEVSGLVARAGDADALAVALRRLCDDPELAQRLARDGHAGVSDFAWTAVAEGYGRLYRELSAAT